MIFVTVGTHEQQFNRLVKAVDDLVADGTINVTVSQRYPLADAARAHADLQARLTVGSVVLVP